MAIKNLYFKADDNLYIRVEYNDETKKVTNSFSSTGNAQTVPNDVPVFLGPNSLTNSVPAKGTDLYMHIDGNLIYKVKKDDRFPNAYVQSSYFEPLTYQVESRQDASQYGYPDGEIIFNLLKGSGYVYPNTQALNVPAEKLPEFNNQGGARLGFTGYAGEYTRDYRDALTREILTITETIYEPPCTLLIESVEATPESVPGANDGAISITATSDNAIEYSINGTTFQDSPEFTGLGDGDYVVRARDKNQHKCIQQKPVFVGSLPCDIVIDQVEVLHESFSGQADGRITVLASSERDIEYALENPQGIVTPFQESNIFSNLSPAGPTSGTVGYKVFARLRAANSCTTNQTVNIEPGTLLTADITNIICGGSATGRILAQVANPSVQNANAPYTYLWANGSTSTERRDLIAGAYTVTVTTSNGRSKDFTFTVMENTPLTVAATIENGNVYLDVSGGTPPYSYLWSDSSTAQNRTGLPLGLYTVTVTDTNGCKKTQAIQVRLEQHYFTDNPVALEVIAAEWETKLNLSFICECWVELEYLSGEFVKVAEKEQPAFEGGAVFRWEDVLRSYVKPSLPQTDISEEGIKRLDSNFKRFYLVYTEKHGEPPTESTFSQQETFYIHLGGLSDEVYADQTFFSEYLPQVKPFYTWQPVEKDVLPESPEYLYYLVQSTDLDVFEVKAKLYFDGEEDPEIITLYSQSGCQRWELFGFAVGYDQLSLGAYSCKLCYKYEVYVTKPESEGGELISEIRTYYLNERQYLQARFFFFLNSFGCFDTLQATGKAKGQLKVDETRADLILPHDFKSSTQRSEVIEKAGASEIQIPIGFYSKDQLERLQDFSLSNEYYLYEKPPGFLARVTPITVDVGNSLIFDEAENLQDFDFSFSLPRQKRFSPKIFAPANNDLRAFAIFAQTSGNLANGQINISVEGGKAPYTFLWADGATTQNRSGIAAGTYSLIIKDSSVPKKAVALCGLILENNDNLAWRAKENSAYCIKE